MVFSAAISPEIFAWVVIPILIFLARIADVSLGTIRIIFVARGVKYLAPIVGFFEVLIWATIFAYAGGFAMGTFAGIKIDERLSIGKVRVRIITSKKRLEIVEALKKAHFKTTSLDASGTNEKVTIISVFINRKSVKRVTRIIREIDPNAFYSVEDMRSVSEGRILPKKRNEKRYHEMHRPARKGK
jgi:uncharacterized protein YebE (UPF0316 family)